MLEIILGWLACGALALLRLARDPELEVFERSQFGLAWSEAIKKYSAEYQYGLKIWDPQYFFWYARVPYFLVIGPPFAFLAIRFGRQEMHEANRKRRGQ